MTTPKSSKALNLNGKPTHDTHHYNIQGHLNHCNSHIELHVRYEKETSSYYISRRCTCGKHHRDSKPRHTTFTKALNAAHRSDQMAAASRRYRISQKKATK